MTPILPNIEAMAELLVKNELIRLAPVRCAICTPDEPCWFCRPFVAKQDERSAAA